MENNNSQDKEMLQENKGIWLVLERIGLLFSFLSIILGVGVFIASEDRQRNAEVYQAWQVITAAHGQTGSGGRKEALEFLNSKPMRNPWFWLTWSRQSLAGLAAPKAYLPMIKLPGANMLQANIQNANLSQADMQGAYLREANMQGAYLGEANLQGANLVAVNLQKAILRGANLQRTKLLQANLQEVDLREAGLQGAEYTDRNTTPETCRKHLLKYPCPTIFPNKFDPKEAGMILNK